MITYVTVVAQQQSSRVSRLPTGFTHSTLQTPPAFAKNHLSDLREKQPSHVIYTSTYASFYTRGTPVDACGAYAAESRTVTGSSHLLSSSSGPTRRWAHSCTFRSLPIGQNRRSIYFHAFFRAHITTLCYRFYAYFIDVVTGF